MQNYFISVLITWKPNSIRREVQLELGGRSYRSNGNLIQLEFGDKSYQRIET